MRRWLIGYWLIMGGLLALVYLTPGDSTLPWAEAAKAIRQTIELVARNAQLGAGGGL